MSFDPAAVRVFRCVGYGWDAAACRASLRYALDEMEFTEEVTFEGASPPTSEAGRRALDRCLRHLHLAAGVSYYKAALPPEIRVETGPVPDATARFFDDLYLHGLGELAYRHQVDLRGRIRFPRSDDVQENVEPFELPRRTAIPVGGGKDSIVTIEALKAAGEPAILFSVGDYQPIRATADVAGLERLLVRRRIDPALVELNRQGAINGHVPISAVIAFILAAAAVLYGFDAAALSNERSADEPNLHWNGWAINHQYSKSSAFEKDFNALVERSILPGFRYFSFLRPLSELAITAAFSQVPRAYREAFRSCNTAFRLDEGRRGSKWCGDCPKCRFVFLALAPFLAKDDVTAIFGADLLDDPSQEAGYAELLEIDGHKPFECVGEVGECRAALAHLGTLAEWKGDAVVRRLLPRLGEDVPALLEFLRPSGDTTLPQRFRSFLPTIPQPRTETFAHASA